MRSYVHLKLGAAARAGHELTIVAPGERDREETNRGGKIVWLASPRMPFDANYRMFRGRRAVWRVLDAETPDIVEGSSPWGSGQLAGRWPGPAARALIFHQDFVAGYPYVALGDRLSAARIDRLFSPYWRYLRRLSERFDVTVAGGAWLADRLAGFGVHNPVAVPFGIETGHFRAGLRDELLRRELLALCGAPATGRLLIAVGRLHPEKRHRTIIEAFSIALRRRPDLGLVLVGDGVARATVERLAARCGRIHLAGAVTDRDELARLYASADALVHGSGAETYGLVVAEAMASGLPVVVPDTGGAADLGRRGPSRLYPVGDAPACAAAILDVLATLRRDHEHVAPPPALAEEHFAALFDLYERLIQAKRRGVGSAPPGTPE